MDTNIRIVVDSRDGERALNNVGDRLNRLEKNAALAALSLKGLFTAIGVGAIVDFVDGITAVNNKLKQVTGTGAEFNRVQGELYAIANMTGSAIADTTTLYQKLSLAQETAGLTGAGVIKMTELVSKQMATVGMTTQESAAFLTQFGQAMASGRLQGDEFRSMMETNVPMMDMLAKSMGVTIGQLRQLGSEGKITGKDLADAFFNSQEAIESASGAIDMTISRALVVLKNNAMQAFNEMESGSLAVKAVTEAILLLANNLTEAIRVALAFVAALAISKLVSIARGVDGITGSFAALNKTIRANVFVALLTAIVYVGEKIWSDMIQPLRKFGVNSGIIAKYVAENLINAFLQVGEAAISLFPALGKLIQDTLTPGKSVKESLKEIDDIYAKILTRRTVKLVSDAELKTITEAYKASKKIADVTQQTTDFRQEAITSASQEQNNAQKALRAYIDGLERAAAEQKNIVLYGRREAEVRKAIQEQQDKLAVVGMSLSRQQRDQIAGNIRLKQSYEDIAATQKTLTGVANEITLLGITDTREREKQSALLQYQASVSASVYEANKNNLATLIRTRQQYQDIETTQKTFRAVAQEITLLNIEDTRERRVQQGLLQYQATVSREIYAANADNYAALLKQVQLTEDLNNYRVMMRDIDREIANLQIRDVREREIQNELSQIQLSLGREVYAITQKQIELRVRERSEQRLINDELERARGLMLGGFSERVKEMKRTEDAYEALTAREGELATVTQDREILEQALAVQRIENMREIARLTADHIGEVQAQNQIELAQLRSLNEQGLISHQQYLDAKLAADMRYYDNYREAVKKNIEFEARAKLAANNNMVAGIELTTEEQKKAAASQADFAMKTDYQKTQFALENSATVLNALGAQNKKAFEAAKALNIAVALMNTYRAATVALASYPPPFNFVAAAASVALGMAQVAAIRSQTYSGRALGGGVMGGGSYIVGERGPELFTPNTNGAITPNRELAAGGGTTQVNFTIVANDTRGFDELLTARRGLITQIISDAQLEKGRRL